MMWIIKLLLIKIKRYAYCFSIYRIVVSSEVSSIHCFYFSLFDHLHSLLTANFDSDCCHNFIGGPLSNIFRFKCIKLKLMNSSNSSNRWIILYDRFSFFSRRNNKKKHSSVLFQKLGELESILAKNLSFISSIHLRNWYFPSG